jgi:hypothetical protein
MVEVEGERVLAAACAREVPAPSAPGPLGLPDREAEGVALSVADDDRPRVRLWAPRLYAYDDSLLQVLVRSDTARVRARLFDVHGAPSGHLTADTLLYYEAQSRFEARGGIVVTSQTSGRTLETEALSWLEAMRRIHAPGLSRITSPGENVRGYNLDADESLTTYSMTQFSAEVEVDDDGNPVGEQ